jgi:hypothetical protein
MEAQQPPAIVQQVQERDQWETVRQRINCLGPLSAQTVKPMTFAPQNQEFCRVLKKTGEVQKLDVSGMSDIQKVLTLFIKFLGGK